MATIKQDDFIRSVADALQYISFYHPVDYITNLARAYERLGLEPEARATFLRAAWVSPVLLHTMLPDVAATAAAEVTRLEKELKEGKLSQPPPLPE